jgi:hypothetical protein
MFSYFLMISRASHRARLFLNFSITPLLLVDQPALPTSLSKVAIYVTRSRRVSLSQAEDVYLAVWT